MPRKTEFWAFHTIRFIFNGQKTLAFSLCIFQLQHGCAWGLTAVNPPSLESSQSIAFTLRFLQLYEIWQIVFFRVKTQRDLHAKGTWNIDDRTEKAHPNPPSCLQEHLPFSLFFSITCWGPSDVQPNEGRFPPHSSLALCKSCIFSSLFLHSWICDWFSSSTQMTERDFSIYIQYLCLGSQTQRENNIVLPVGG